MRYIGFEPDPQYDPLEGYGYFITEDGQRRYGFDPEAAAQLDFRPPELDNIAKKLATMPDEPDQRLAAGDWLDYKEHPKTRQSPGEAQRSSEREQERKALADYRQQRFNEALGVTPERSTSSVDPAAAPEPTTPAQPGGELGDFPGIEKTSPEFKQKLVQMARQRGLDPNAVAAVMAVESGFSSSIQSGGDSQSEGKDAHAGLIQFSRKNWPKLAASVGRPEVTWEDMRGLSDADQLDFVFGYYDNAAAASGRSLQGMTAGDLALATFTPAHLDKEDDHVIFSASSSKGFDVDPSNPRHAALDRNKDGRVTPYEQNPGLDRDKDGNITTGEMRHQSKVQQLYDKHARGGMSAEANMSLDDPTMQNQSIDYRGGDQLSRMGAAPPPQLQPGMPPPGQPGMPQPGMPMPGQPQPAGMGMPQIPGMGMSGARMQGMPLTVEQELARKVGVHDSYLSQYEAAERARDERVRERNRLAEEYGKLAEQRRMDALQREQHRQTSLVQAKREIQQLVRQPLKKLDSNRLIRNSSHGQLLLGALAVALGDFGRTFSGSGGANLAMQTINRAIEGDIADQREEIRAGEVTQRNRLAYWSQRLNSLEAGEAATRIEMQEAARLEAKKHELTLQNADIKGQFEQLTGQLEAQREAGLNAIEDDRRNRLMLEFKPKAPPQTLPQPVGPNSPLIKDPQLRERAAREFMSWKPSEQAAQLRKYKNDQQGAKDMQRAVLDLAEAYGGRFNDEGKFVPITGKGEVDVGSSATGPWWNPADWADSGRDKVIKDAWAKIEMFERMNWATEPNGEKAQQLFGKLNQPKYDDQVEEYVERLWRNVNLMARHVESTAMPQVIAYSWYRDHPVGGRPVQTMVPMGAPTGAR